MRAERARAGAAVALVLAAAAAAAAGCGGRPEPVRIGVVVDCQGAFRSLGERQLRGAELPLLARGARKNGAAAAAGVSPATVGGRQVELRIGCTESGEFSTLVASVRRLVERDGVQAIVAGGPFTVDGLVLREVARRYPDVVFVAAPHGPREVTLERPASNLVRVASDYGQSVAGLATYARRTLGWRRVGLAVDAWVAGWGAETVFVREFCALGGRVVRRTLLANPAPAANDLGTPPRGADGVVVLASPILLNPTDLGTLARRTGAPRRRLLLGPGVVADADLVRGAGSVLDGVAGAAYAPPLAASADGRRLLRAHAAAWPGAPRGEAASLPVLEYRNAMEALLRAYDAAGGDAAALPDRLAGLRTTLAGVPLRLDASRQAVSPATIVRIVRAAGPDVEVVRTGRSVDQSAGGLVPAAYVPTGAGQACRPA